MAIVKVEIDFLIANFFALGLKEVSVGSLKKIIDLVCSKYPEVDISMTTDDLTFVSRLEPNIYNYKSTADSCVVRRGYWDEPRTFLDNLIQGIKLPEEQSMVFKNGLLAAFSEEVLNKVFGVVFTPEYVKSRFALHVPDEYREPIIKIIHSYCQDHNLIPQIPQNP